MQRHHAMEASNHAAGHCNTLTEQELHPINPPPPLLNSEQETEHDEGIEMDLVPERPKLVAVRRHHNFIDDLLLQSTNCFIGDSLPRTEGKSEWFDNKSADAGSKTGGDTETEWFSELL